MSQLVLEGVSRRFGGLWAVRDVDLEIPSGSITGLIGPNGAGKSTIVNLIAGLSRLTEGRVTLDGEPIHELMPDRVARKGVARTFQNIRLLNEASVLDNVVLGWHEQVEAPLAAGIFGLGAAARARKNAYANAQLQIEQFGMGRYAGFSAGELSYGHQRRVEIMRALAMRPKVLLLDEPAAGMNDVEANELGRHLSQLARDGLAILLIEHNMQFVMSLCRKIYVLAAGELITSGAPDEVRANQRVIDAYLGGEECSASAT
jgi:branched-chain amino acid transport system ATP-binding protein